MTQHLLTFELSADGNELFLHGDEAGLRYLSIQLLRLADHAARGESEHTHLMTDAWGGDGLSGEPQSETDRLLNHVKIYGWPKHPPNDRNAIINRMIASWVWCCNLQPFLKVLARAIACDFTPEDWAAISYGIVGTDDEAERWFGYELIGQYRAELQLALDAESNLVHLRVTIPDTLSIHIETAVAIFSTFHVTDPNA